MNVNVKTPLLITVCLLAISVFSATSETETNLLEPSKPLVAESEIDKLVFAQLEQANIHPVLCSDAVFVRRVYLDLLGTLPTAKEARDFIENKDERNKRQLLVDQLLARDEFADYWAMKWGDILRIKAEFPVNLWPNAAQAYHHWVRESIASNKSYDEFVRGLLTASGSNFRVGPVNFYRAVQNRTPEEIARVVALTFMGARAENWPSNQLQGMAVFFSQIGYKPTGEWKEEHVFWNPFGTNVMKVSGAPGQASIAVLSSNAVQTSAPMTTVSVPLDAVFPDGTKVHLSVDKDPREVFADWLTRAKNPWFARAISNRIWAWLMGRGIIQEPDDIRDDNPPSNPALLEYLEKEMVAHHYNLKNFYRLILTSKTYQLVPMPLIAGDVKKQPIGYAIRRLEAEVIIDAINKVVGASDLYTSPIPEPFTYIPKGMPAVKIADGSITSSSLALFGRSARATGMENERDNKPTPAQWLYLLNSSEIQRKLEQGTNLQSIISGRRKPVEVLDEIYLTVLSRFPTPEEAKVVWGYIQEARTGPTQKAEKAEKPLGVNRPGKQRRMLNATRKSGLRVREGWIDIAWALINSEEFLYRH